MKRCMLKKLVSMMMALAMVITSVSWTDFGTLDAKAASNAPKVEYTFEEISEMANIPVMNLTMADASKYDTLKTDKEKKQNISKFELVNTDGKGKDIYLETTVDEETGEDVYPLTAKGRGNSSWTMPTGKKPYNIKFDKKQDILGMGKAKSWCLISNWVDTSYIRNYLAYEMACQLGLGTPDCEMVALCINGAFEGIYLITEKVGLNDYRTEIPEGENDGDVNGDGIVTEIIVEADIRADEYQEPGRFKSDNNVSYVPKDPDPEDLMNSELEEIEKELNAMEAAVMTGANYEDYIDVDSWVDTYIINELAKNPDFGFGHQNCYASTYLYFREGGKVFAGPVWDFDIAYGRNDYSKMESEGFRDIAGTTGYLSKATKYYKELFENTDFEEKVIKRWKEIRETILPTWMGTTFNEGYESVKVLNPIDIEIWGNHEGRVAGSYDMGRDPLAFEDEVAYVRNFINERVAWLDEQWNVDEITKKFSGSWKRWDVAADGNYTSFEELAEATEAGNAKTDVDDIWDGGYGGKEKSGTDLVERGNVQSSIPGVKLENPITIQMVRQRGEYDWSSDTTHAYDIWKDGTASQGFGGVKDTITVTESGRYVGLTTADYYIGDTTAVMGKNNAQVYIIDVGTDGSVTLHDGSVKLSYEAREVAVEKTNYGKIEAVNGGYKVSYVSNQSGNTGKTIGGTGNKQFRIYLPADCTDGNDQNGTLSVTRRPAESNYANVPLKQEVTYVQAEGERPVSWNVEGDAVTFDETKQMITAVKAGTATITATAAGGMKSSVTVTVTEKTAAAIEYDVDPTLGKYFGNTDENIVAATEAEKGSWATVAPENLARFSFRFKMSQDEVNNASGFVWQTKFADQIIGGVADYYVFVNGNPAFAATADSLDYAVAGFDSSNTVQISEMQLPEDLYAYMNGKAGNTENCLDIMKEYVQAGANTIDIFVHSEDGAATALPYICGTTKVSEGTDPIEPDAPNVPVEPEEPEIQTVEVTIVSDDKVVIGETAELTALLDKEVSDTSVNWAIIEGAEYADLEDDILIAKSVGKVTVKAVSNYNKECCATKEIEIVRPEVAGIEIVDGDITLEESATKVLDVKVLPEEAGDAVVTWTTTDAKVATVDAEGKVTATGIGTAIIKAVYDKNSDITAEIKVTVVPVEVKVTISASDKVALGKSIELNAALDKKVSDTSVTWMITDGEENATLEGNVLTGKVLGKVTVKAVSNYNKECYATKEIEIVRPSVESVKITDGDFSLTDTESKKLTVNVLPENADDAAWVWSTSNKGIVTVDAEGKVTAVGVGQAEITVVCDSDNSIKDTVTVTVLPTKVAVTIDCADSVELGKLLMLNASLDKEVADTTVTWTITEGEENATLSGNVLTAKAVGKVTVKAVSNYNDECYAEKEIEVVRPEAESIVINEGNISLTEGDTKELTFKTLPEEAEAVSVTWETSDGKVATVDAEGKVTAIGVGTATISAVCNENKAIKAEITVTVVPVEVKLTIDSADTVVLGEQIELHAALDKEVSDESVIWTIVEGKENAALTGNILTANAAGKVTVKAVSNYNKDCYATKKIEIVRPAVESIAIAEGNITLEDAASKVLTVNVLPEEAGDVSVTWTTSDENVATVDAEGKVTATGAGTAKITAVYNENEAIKAEITVTVVPADVKVTINSADKVVLGETIELKAALDKAVSDNSVTWTIAGGEENATLSGNMLTAKAVGTVTVKAVSNYNKDSYAEKVITIVRPAVQSVEITEGDITLEETKSQTLHVNTLPENAEETAIKWTTSDSKVATVDANGKVVAVGVGTATITAACENNTSVKDTVKVTVTKMAFELGFAEKDTVEMEDLSTYSMKAVVSNDNIPNKNVTWSSSNAAVATVDAYGKVTAKRPGTANITAVSMYDTSKAATIAVKVTATTINVTVNAADKLTVGEETKLSASVDKAVADTSVKWTIVYGNNYAQLSGNVLKATAEGTVTVKAVSNYNNNCYATKTIEIEKAAAQEQAPMVPGTPLAKPVKISMQLQMGQYEWSADTTHAYDIWADGKAVHGFGKEKYELEITEAGRYVGLTSASYYVGDTTVTMADGDVQVYVIDVANDGSVTVYDGKVKINYAERTTSVVDTTYANVEKTDDGYFLSFKEDGTGNAGTRIANK